MQFYLYCKILIVYLQKVTNKDNKKMISKPSLRATLRAMKPTQVERIPLGMFTHSSVRNCATTLGLDLDRKYSVHLDREAGRYVVTRIR